MENENNRLLLIKKLTSTKYPLEVQHITNNTAAAINGFGCSIIDIREDREIKKISTEPCLILSIHKNQQKIALSDHKKIEIYNIASGECEWSRNEKDYIIFFDFSPHDDIIVLHLNNDHYSHNVLAHYNYIQNTCTDKIISMGYINFKLHQKKQLMCATAGNKVFIYSLLNSTINPKAITLSHGSNDCQINSNNFFAIMSCYQNMISILNLEDENTYQLIKSKKNELFIKMLFYSRGAVLVTISQLLKLKRFNYIMRFWDLKIGQPIYETLLYSTRQSKSSIIYSFSFSPDGKELIIKSHNGCKLYSVPFEVRYEGVKEKFPYLLFLLKQYVIHQNPNPNKDVMKLLANVLLETFRR
jgi:WD40 repeat protein